MLAPDRDLQRPLWRRLPTLLGPLDWIAVGLLAAGGLCVATGALSTAAAGDIMQRVLPLLLFLGTVIVLAELTAEAEVFDVIATFLARLGRGRYPALFLLCVGFAALTTATLNLDTTAVLLTPVMLALARKLRVDPLPLAVTTVWLANTASILLPVSNLTNLLAQQRIGLSPLGFAERMWLPQLAVLLVTMAVLWVAFWRRARTVDNRYAVPEPHRPRHRGLYLVAGLACVMFVIAILVQVQLGVASAVAAAIVVVGFVVVDRGPLRWKLIPWRLLVMVTGLFLVMQTVGEHGLDAVARSLMGSGDGLSGALRAAGVGAGMSNLVNNLPAYVAGEAVVLVDNHLQLLALLLGTNVGPVITPWASLATLLWYERCRTHGVRIPLVRLVVAGAVLAVSALVTGVLALVVSR
ncbi:MAG: SLC13 family permease [Actinocatenispora sp.]